jgi:hypothetical protein
LPFLDRHTERRGLIRAGQDDHTRLSEL